MSRFLKTGSYNDAPKSGRPKKLDARAMRRLERAVLKDPRATVEDLARDATIDSGVTAVKHALKALKFGVFMARKKFWLSKVARWKRKRWCRMKKHWPLELWRKIVWCDEVRIEVGIRGGPDRVRRRPGTGLWPRYLQPTFRSGRVSVGFWAAYVHGSRSPLIFVRKRTKAEYERPNDRGGMTARQYCNEVLEPHFIPYWNRIQGTQHKLQFMQDRSGPHRAGYTAKLLAKHNIAIFPWIASSPDLNPIENAWRILKQRLRKRFRRRGLRPRSQRELIQAAQEEWEAIPQEMLDRLVDSMPERIKMVLKAKGGHIRW